MFQPDKLADLISRKAEPKPFTLESLIAWLETKNAAQTYDYRLATECLVAQAFGLVIPGLCFIANCPSEIAHDTFKAIHRIAVSEPWTMGAAITRARAYQAAQS